MLTKTICEASAKFTFSWTYVLLECIGNCNFGTEFTFHYHFRLYLTVLQQDSFIYICVTPPPPDFSEQESFAFLDDMIHSFTFHKTRLRDSVVDLMSLEKQAADLERRPSKASILRDNVTIQNARKNFSCVLAEQMVITTIFALMFPSEMLLKRII